MRPSSVTSRSASAGCARASASTVARASLIRFSSMTVSASSASEDVGLPALLELVPVHARERGIDGLVEVAGGGQRVEVAVQDRAPGRVPVLGLVLGARAQEVDQRPALGVDLVTGQAVLVPAVVLRLRPAHELLQRRVAEVLLVLVRDSLAQHLLDAADAPRVLGQLEPLALLVVLVAAVEVARALVVPGV